MAEEKHVNTEGWHVAVAIIVLLAVVGYLYYQSKQHPQTGTGDNRLNFFRIPTPAVSRGPILPVSGTPTPTPVKVR